jgi:hypothetical protein
LTSKKPIVLALVTLLVLSAVPAGVVISSSIPLQTAQAQPLGSEIASDVLDSVFGDDENGAEEEDEDDNDDGNGATTQQGDDNQNIDQTAEQENDQDETASQDVTQENSQDEENVQDNTLDTGDNTATVAQDNDATQTVAAATDAAAESEAESEDDGSGDNYYHGKKKKHHDGDYHHYSGSSDSDSDSTSSVADAEAIANSAAEATGIQDQNNTADVDQDSSIHDVDLSNNVAFGDDTNEQTAIPIIDQDQRADQRAANLDIEVVRIQTPTQPPTPPDDGELPPEDLVFCIVLELGMRTFCFDTEQECELGEEFFAGECEGFETPPPGALSCSIVEGRPDCL